MRLDEWLASGYADYDSAFYASLALDNMPTNKHAACAAVALLPSTGEPSIIYLDGAYPEMNSWITGVDPQVYRKQCVGEQRAWELLDARLPPLGFIITYGVDYYAGYWFRSLFPRLVRSPIIDVIQLHNLLVFSADGIPPHVQSLQALSEELSACSERMRGHAPAKFDDVCRLCGVDTETPEGRPAFVHKAFCTRGVFNALVLM
jgi:hypothetical protein